MLFEIVFTVMFTVSSAYVTIQAFANAGTAVCILVDNGQCHIANKYVMSFQIQYSTLEYNLLKSAQVKFIFNNRAACIVLI